jgi:hypothetical protein
MEQWDTACDSQAKAFLIAVREASALMSEGGRVVAITTPKGAGREAYSLGWAWVRPRRPWSRSSVTSP